MNTEVESVVPSAPDLLASENPARPLSQPEGKRNLILGIVLNLVAIPMCGAAFVFAPREAFVSLAAALLIAMVVFVSVQFGVMLQRNGTFALIGLGLVLTLLVPLGVSFCASGAEWIRLLLDVKHSRETRMAVNHEAGAAGSALHRDSSLVGSGSIPGETSTSSARTVGMAGAEGRSLRLPWLRIRKRRRREGPQRRTPPEARRTKLRLSMILKPRILSVQKRALRSALRDSPRTRR